MGRVLSVPGVLAFMPLPLAFLAASTVAGPSDEAALAPTADGFVATGSMSTGLEGLGAQVLLSGKVLIAGGSGFNPDPGYLYNPASGTFSSSGTMTVAPGRGGHTMTLLGTGKVLVAGGSDPCWRRGDAQLGPTLRSCQQWVHGDRQPHGRAPEPHGDDPPIREGPARRRTAELHEAGVGRALHPRVGHLRRDRRAGDGALLAHRRAASRREGAGRRRVR